MQYALEFHERRKLRLEDRTELEHKIDSIKSEITNRYFNNDIVGVTEHVLDHERVFYEYLGKLYTPKAVILNMNKHRLGFTDGYMKEDFAHEFSSINHMLTYNRRRGYVERVFGFEDEIMDAKHPKRVMKLWDASKQKLERMYGFTFNDRMDLMVMNHLFDAEKDVFHSFQGLREAYDEYIKFRDVDKGFIEEYGKKVHDDILDFIISKNLRQKSATAAIFLLDMLQRIEDTESIPIEKDDEGKYEWKFSWTEVDKNIRNNIAKAAHLKPDGFIHYGNGCIEENIALMLKLHEGLVTFHDAGAILHRGLFEKTGIFKKGDRMIFRYMNADDLYDASAKSKLDTIIRKHMQRPHEFEDAMKINRHYAEEFLRSWKASAPDYEKLFSYNYLGRGEERFIKEFYNLKFGEIKFTDEEIYSGRLPLILRDLVKQGIISADEIDPPLKEHYPSPDEIISPRSVKLLAENAASAAISTLPLSNKQASIKTTIDPSRLLTMAKGDLVKLTAHSLQENTDYWDPSGTYYLLGKGKHTVLVTTEEYYPNGEQAIGTVYRFALIEEGSREKGVFIPLPTGETLQIKKQGGREVFSELEKKLWDNDDKSVPLSTYTAITEIETNEFVKNYFKDFMMHALLYSSGGYDEVRGLMNRLDSWEGYKMHVILGPRNRLHLSTFEMGGRFAFQLSYDQGHHQFEEIFIVSETLREYLEDVGIPFRYDNNLDESGRRKILQKMEARKYFKENFWKIQKELEGENLGRILHAAFLDKNIGIKYFGPFREPCKDCGEKYIEGILDLGEYRSLGARELHVISKHPSTYKDEWKYLQYIGEFIDKHKDHEVKINIVPGLEDAILSYAEVDEKHSEASAESFDYWYSSHGGIDAEEEEIADNPALKRLVKEERKLHKTERDLANTLKKKEKELDKTYKQLTGKDPAGIDWHKEMIFINILKYAAPSLLHGLDTETLSRIKDRQWSRNAQP